MLVKAPHYLHTGTDWWTLSPGSFNGSIDCVGRYTSDGYWKTFGIAFVGGVLPMIFLALGTLVREGDGSPEDLFIVE